MKDSLNIRPRRNRRSQPLRDLIAETNLATQDLVMPFFVSEDISSKEAIASMPGQFRYSLSDLRKQVAIAMDRGITSFALFPKVSDSKKDKYAKESTSANNILVQSIQAIKSDFPNAVLFSDVAMDPYSSDGHDGLVENGEVVNDETLKILAQMAITQAKAGADFVSPSDMMDGRIGFIRHALDEQGLQNTGIMSYAAKYASSFYGPFRDALDSAPRAGDKKTYQMDYRNAQEAVREIQLDVQEGADIVMVKPALTYLDVIQRVSKDLTIPLAAYNVSGEYSMIKAAAEKGWMDEKSAVLESLTSIKRAGAKIIFTYWALEVAQWL